MKTLLTFLLIFLIEYSIGQNISIDMLLGCPYCTMNKSDSVDMKLCYIDSPISVIRQVSSSRIYRKNYESSIEIGMFLQNKRQGWWAVYDDKNRLIAKKYCIDDEYLYKFHYKKGHLIAIEMLEWYNCEPQTRTSTGRCGRTIELILLKKRGRPFRKHFYNHLDGTTKIINLRNSEVKIE